MNRQKNSDRPTLRDPQPWNAPLTFDEKMRRGVTRFLMRLPPTIQIKLSGKPPVTHGKESLHPQMQLLLALSEKTGGLALTDVPAPEGRWKMRRDSFVFAASPIQVGRVRDIMIPTPHGHLAARHYAPTTRKGRRPLLVFLHGGGYSLGDLETHDAPCRIFCKYAGVHVLSIDYRLAPEWPFPAALQDAEEAFAWAVANAASLGADPACMLIGGDSAGANLAAVVTQTLARAGKRQPNLQLLIYPAVDWVASYASREHFGEGFLLTRKDIIRFAEMYAIGQDPSNPRLSPLRCEDLSGLAPALVVTATFDPLRDEGEAYAHALEKAGTPVTLWHAPRLIHGFINLTDISPACQEATIGVAKALKKLLPQIAARKGSS